MSKDDNQSVDIEKRIKEEVERQVAGLKKKNKELLGKLKKRAEKEGDLKEYYEEQLAELKEAKAEAEARAAAIRRQYERNLVASKIASALAAAGGLNPDLAEAATLLLQRKAEVQDGKVRLDGMSPKKYVREWKKADGKAFFVGKTEPGAGKGGRGGDDRSEWERFFDPGSKHYNLTKQLECKRQNPDLYKKLVAKF